MKRLGIDMQTVFGMPPVDHVKLAAELGCGHVSTGLAPVPWKLERFPMWSLHDADTRREMIVAMRDLGITLSAVEGFAIRANAHVGDRAADLDVAAELGAKRVNSVCMEPDLARGLEQLAILAELAGQRALTLTLEFAPPHTINTLAGALSAVRAVGSPNIRLVIDAMHLFRSGGTIADLVAIEPTLIGYAQFCDVPSTSKDGNYYNEACFDRKCPGEGELPLDAFVRALPRDVPIGIEVPMLSEIRAGDTLNVVRRIVKSSIRLMEQNADQSTQTIT